MFAEVRKALFRIEWDNLHTLQQNLRYERLGLGVGGHNEMETD